MFEPLESQVGIGKRIWTLSISLFLHALVITALVVIPLIYYNILPKPEILTFLAEPPAPPPPPSPPAPPAHAFHFTEHIAHYYAPTQIPKTIPPPTQEAPVFESQVWNGVPGGVSGGVIGGVSGGVLGGVLGIKAPPKMTQPPPPPEPERLKPLRVGGDLQAAKLVYKVDPEYPRLAQLARVHGTVIMQVTVDEQGNVSDVQVLRGHPLLVNAAVDAIKKWKYKPTYLNGRPVPVIATVTITFALNSDT